MTWCSSLPLCHPHIFLTINSTISQVFIAMNVHVVHRFLYSVCPTIIFLVLFLLVIVFYVLLRVTTSDYLFGIFKLFLDIRSLITSLVSSNCSQTYGLWLSLWFLQTFLRHTASDYLFGIFKHFLDIRLWLPLWYLQTFLRHTASDYFFDIFKLFLDLRPLITSFVSSVFS